VVLLVTLVLQATKVLTELVLKLVLVVNQD
jgi:hypothetical protein